MSAESADGYTEVKLDNVKSRVHRVEVSGLQRTHNDVVVGQLQELLTAQNFSQMVQIAEKTRLKMEKLGLFKKISVFIDTSKGPNVPPNSYDIKYTVTESRRFAGGISTLVGTNDGSLLVQGRLPNCLGRGEQVTLDYQHGAKKNLVGYALNFQKPLQGNPDLTFSSSLYQRYVDYFWSGYSQMDRGVNAQFGFKTLLGSHIMNWEGVWRDLTSSSKTTSFAVREQSGHSLKSSLSHALNYDTRDNAVIPNDGILFQVSQELAGLGGDVRFLKHELKFQAFKSLLFDTVVQFSLGGGLVKPLAGIDRLGIHDRFFLGGPLTFRGFQINGLAPSQDGNALGADCFWISGLHFYAPLPFTQRNGGFADLFRMHIWANGGGLQNLQLNTPHKEKAISLMDQTRFSVGAGIVFKLGGIARLELNYSHPLRTLHGDGVQQGFQFGIGMHFS